MPSFTPCGRREGWRTRGRYGDLVHVMVGDRISELLTKTIKSPKLTPIVRFSIGTVNGPLGPITILRCLAGRSHQVACSLLL